MARVAASKQQDNVRADGRTARSERTMESVVEAFISLIEEGDLRPSAARIAERAGVSLRTVFHHFEDLETLYTVVSERQTRRFFVPARIDGGSVAERIEVLVSARTRMLEGVTPVRRAALVHEPFSPALAERLRWARGLLMKEIAHVFAPELDAMPEAYRRETLAALVAATEWGTWESLRAHQGLSVAQARKAMARTVAALLA